MGRCTDKIEIIFAISDAVVDDYVISSPPNICAEPEVVNIGGVFQVPSNNNDV